MLSVCTQSVRDNARGLTGIRQDMKQTLVLRTRWHSLKLDAAATELQKCCYIRTPTVSQWWLNTANRGLSSNTTRRSSICYNGTVKAI